MSKKRKESKAKKKNIFLSKKAFIVLLIILAILLVMLFVQLNLVENPLDEFNKETVEIEIRDACSIIAGRLIHTIPDEGVCRNVCVAECETVPAELIESTFVDEENSCNSCTCLCK